MGGWWYEKYHHPSVSYNTGARMKDGDIMMELMNDMPFNGKIRFADENGLK